MSDSADEIESRCKKPRLSLPIKEEQDENVNTENVESSADDTMMKDSTNATFDETEFQQSPLIIKSENDSDDVDNSFVNNTILNGTTNQSVDPSIASDGKKITDLPNKCLVKIMEELDFVDFMNVANSTKKLCEAACEIYSQRFAGKQVNYNGGAVYTKGLELDVTDTTIDINESRSCLKILRAFGTLITKLKLNFQKIGDRRSQAISLALNMYCTKSLKELEWHFCPKDAMAKAKNKFTKLESLRIVSGHLGEEMSLFVFFFPNLQRLEVTNVEVTNRKCIERTFHLVTHMKFNIESRKGMDFLKSNIKAALDLNPQLTSFSLGANCDAKLLSHINDRLPKLETLEIENPRNKFFDSDENRVCFNLVKNLSLDIANCKDSFTNIPFRFKCLKRFKLNACCPHRDEWIEFATRNPNLILLKLLNFNWFYVMNEVQMVKIAKGLPKLKKFILDWRVSSTQTVTKFVEESKSLKEMRLSMRTPYERAAIFAVIGDGWQIDIDEHFLTLQRKND